MTESGQDRLSRGYRVIRVLAGGAESPWRGSLVCGPTGEMGVTVDAGLLGAEWVGWTAAVTGHVLTPRDILRRPDGHDVLLPVCTERVEEFLARRAATGADLTSGEAVTVAVSLLRGWAELQETPSDVRGAWWLTDHGRPVFASDSADRAVAEATIELLSDLTRGVPELADALAEVIDPVPDPRRLDRALERAEGRVFSIADPVALATTTFGPKRVRDRMLPEGRRIEEEAPAPNRPWQLAFARHLDADWADLVSQTTTGLWRSVRARRPGGRRRPWLLAGGLAAAIVAGGLLWPTGPGGPATADGAASRDAEAPSPVPSPSAAPVPMPDPTARGDAEDATHDDSTGGIEPSEGAPADLASIADALLAGRSACGGESACLEGVLETADAQFPPGVVDLAAEERSVTLLDEFGGAAVLRAEAAGGTPQLVVIVRADGRWLLRDVYDVAQQ